MRSVLSLLHRWFGLSIATFLFIAGLTGAIIAWDHELDALLNPSMYKADGYAQAQTPLELARQFESTNPGLMVTFMPLALEDGEAMSVMVSARKTPSGHTPELPYNQIALNPYSGEVQAQRQWGEISLSPENLLPFIYKLHYSLHIPESFNMQTGVLLMGIIGIVWMLDCFVALSISFPSRSQWRKSFAFRWGSNRQKITFDLHRSGGMWVWFLLLVMAITSISMNLGSQVVRPIVSVFSNLTPSPLDTKQATPFSDPEIKREAVVALAQAEAKNREIQAPLGGIFYSPMSDIYGVGFYAPGMGHGDMGLGNPWLYFDGKTGAYLGGTIPGQGTAGDIFMQLQFPLHSGRIIGIPGRIIITVMGLAVAMLSVTGVIIWARKRKSRKLRIAIKNTSSGVSDSNMQPMAD
ncbi:MAG: PepSY domain-containing protein [Moraxellaceae bacterium]|nr:MAG: PepSY domain-containing protein [Moraxellaceae bacterium]